MGSISIRRVYDDTPRAGEKRYLVERLWPRGVRKEDLPLDGWLKDVAPSTELRRWFNHDPARWEEFRRRYLEELQAKPEVWRPLLDAARDHDVVLLYAARDSEHNGALVLREFLQKKSRHRP